MQPVQSPTGQRVERNSLVSLKQDCHLETFEFGPSRVIHTAPWRRPWFPLQKDSDINLELTIGGCTFDPWGDFLSPM